MLNGHPCSLNSHLYYSKKAHYGIQEGKKEEGRREELAHKRKYCADTIVVTPIPGNPWEIQRNCRNPGLCQADARDRLPQYDAEQHAGYQLHEARMFFHHSGTIQTATA